MATGGFTQAIHQGILDGAAYSGLADTNYIAYSENGTSESAYLARTKMNANDSSGAWDAATAANPSVVGNTQALTSPACSGDNKTFTDWCVYSAATNGTQITRWTNFDTSRTLSTGGKLEHAAQDLKVQLAYTD